jgi:2-acylglycerol O-acyltransferase 2
MATLCAYMGLIYILAALFLLAPFSRIAAMALATLWLTVLLPTHPIIWPNFLRNPLFKLWRLYFNYSLAYEQRLDDTKHYLYADYPHGVFPLSQLLGLTVRHHSGWEGERFYGLAADSVFRIPIWRHVMTWLGIVPASRKNVRRCLKRGCAGLTPGGIAEMYLASADADYIFITNRKGFIRMAVEQGVDIIPVYHFGNTQLFSFGPKWLEEWGRRWRFSLGLLYGVGGLPIPRWRPLMMVVGAPVAVVQVPRDAPEFEVVVEEVHQQYMMALQGLYDKYKLMYGWEDHPLIMH